MDAFLIETLRTNGVSNQKLLQQVEQGNVSEWESFQPQFDFTNLITLFQQDAHAFQSAVMDGYALKFVTIKGIQRLLKLKYGIMEKKNYQVVDKGLTGIHVKKEQLNELKHMLSQNWTIHESETNASTCIIISILQTYV